MRGLFIRLKFYLIERKIGIEIEFEIEISFQDLRNDIPNKCETMKFSVLDAQIRNAQKYVNFVIKQLNFESYRNITYMRTANIVFGIFE